MRAPWISAVALLALFGCDNGRSDAVDAVESRASSLVADTRPIWVRHQGQADVGVAAVDYPVSVRALKPEAVRVTKEGIFIQTYSLFVETAGVFVRHDQTFQPPRRGDPGFEEIAPDVYWYYAPG